MPMGEYVSADTSAAVSDITTIYDNADMSIEDEKLRREYELKRRSQRKRRGLLSIFTVK